MTAETVTVRPGASGLFRLIRAYPGQMAAAGAASVFLMAVSWFTDHVTFVSLLFVGAVTVPAWCAYSLLYSLNARFELTPDSLVVRNWLGLRRRLPRYAIASVTKVSYRPEHEERYRELSELTIVLGSDGRALSVATWGWPEDALRDLWQRIGAPWDSWETTELVSLSGLRERHPGLRLPFAHAHNTAFQTLLALGVTALITIAVLAAMGYLPIP
jgi:hypothetical protein